MKKKQFHFVSLFLVLSIVFGACNQGKQQASNERVETLEEVINEPERYTKAETEEFIEMLKTRGLDMSEEYLWGYFFLDNSEDDLAALKDYLVQNEGYALVSLRVFDESADSPYILHVEKVEVHDANSLHQRNEHLYDLADEYHIDLYDGYDVGNTNPDKSIIENEN